MKFTLISAREIFDIVDSKMEELGFVFAQSKFGIIQLTKKHVEIEIESIGQLLKLRNELESDLIVESNHRIRIYNDLVEQTREQSQ